MSSGGLLERGGRKWRFGRVPQLVRPGARPKCRQPARRVENEDVRNVAQAVGEGDVHAREQVRDADPRAEIEWTVSTMPWRQRPGGNERCACAAGECRDRRRVRQRFFQRLLRIGLVVGDRARKALDDRLGPRPDDGSPFGPRRPRRQRPHDRAVWRRPRFSARQRGVRDQSRQRLDVEVGDQVDLMSALHVRPAAGLPDGAPGSPPTGRDRWRR